MWRRVVGVLAVVLSSVGCDQGTKRLAEMTLKNEEPMHFLRGSIQLMYAENTGAWGSLGANWPAAAKFLVLSAMPALVLLSILVFLFRSRSLSRTQLVAFALIVGGGIGNLIDRMVDGYVVDFLFMRAGRLSTNVFNVADVVLLVGVAMLLLERRRQKQPESPPPADAV
jgi:signal peptidase II